MWINGSCRQNMASQAWVQTLGFVNESVDAIDLDAVVPSGDDAPPQNRSVRLSPSPMSEPECYSTARRSAGKYLQLARSRHSNRRNGWLLSGTKQTWE